MASERNLPWLKQGMITETNGFDRRLSIDIIAVNFGIRIAMSQVVDKACKNSSQLGEQCLVLRVIAWKSFFQKARIVRRQYAEEMLQISAMAEALILNENGNGKAAHVGIQLLAKPWNRIAM